MKKMTAFGIMLTLGIIFSVTAAFADTFDLYSPVYVSGNAAGLLFFKSENPAALNQIERITQYRNDIMKRNGSGRNRNADMEAVRVNPNLLTVQMYQPTLAKQFAFNIRQAVLWGQIPSCNLIPDGVTVIFEDSYPINKSEEKDSENGSGGFHLSLVAHLEGGANSKFVKPVPNDLNCGGGYAISQKGHIVAKKKATKYKKGSNGKWQACGDKDPCETLAEIKKDTTEIKEIVKDTQKDVKEIKVDVKEIKTDVKDVKSSVGMPEANEPVDEKTLQQKARKTLDSVGVADKTDAADEKTIHQKARKTLTKVKHIKKVTNRTHLVTEKMSQDLDDIKAHLKIPKRELQNCISCHKDTVPAGKK